jgi:hypothetical protein
VHALAFSYKTNLLAAVGDTVAGNGLEKRPMNTIWKVMAQSDVKIFYKRSECFGFLNFGIAIGKNLFT